MPSEEAMELGGRLAAAIDDRAISIRVLELLESAEEEPGRHQRQRRAGSEAALRGCLDVDGGIAQRQGGRNMGAGLRPSRMSCIRASTEGRQSSWVRM